MNTDSYLMRGSNKPISGFFQRHKYKFLFLSLAVSSVIGVNNLQSFQNNNKVEITENIEIKDYATKILSQTNKNLKTPFIINYSEITYNKMNLNKDFSFGDDFIIKESLSSRDNSSSLIGNKTEKKLLNSNNIVKKDSKIVSTTKKQVALANVISDKYNVETNKALKMVKTAYKVSEERDIDPIVLLGIAAVESRFNEKAKNKSGAVGLTQAMPSAHPEKIRQIRKQGGSMYDIHDNLDVGAQIYSEYLKKHNGNQVLALQQYNGSLKDKKRRYSKKVFQAMSPLKEAVKLANNSSMNDRTFAANVN